MKYWIEYQTIRILWKDIECIAGIFVYKYNDPNYGADADGNRGISKDFIERAQIDEVKDIYENYIDPISKDLEEIIYKEIE